MSAPLSLPTPLPQPDVAEYSIDALNLFLTYTSPEAYEAYFGAPPPPYNPALPIKLWKDDSQATQPAGWQAEYEILQVVVNPQTGVSQLILPPTYVQMFISSQQAAEVNIYGGAPVYPIWVSAPTVATITGTTGFISGVDPNLLSDLADANTLNTQLGGTGVLTYVMAPGPDNFQINYGTETRRQYYFIDSNGQLQWVGFLLRQQYVNGVGAPGSWVNTPVQIPGNMAQKVWMWVPQAAPAGPPANTSVLPMPVRRLYSATNPPPAGGAFESFTQPMVGQPMIVRASV
jgi:hypothetical protein